MMGSTNLTIRIDEEAKREFDTFCQNVGISMSTAFNMYIKAVLRTRQLPFLVTDIDSSRQKKARMELKRAFEAAQEDSVKNGTDKMTMEEIDAEIAAYRREKREKQCIKSS